MSPEIKTPEEIEAVYAVGRESALRAFKNVREEIKKDSEVFPNDEKQSFLEGFWEHLERLCHKEYFEC